MPHDALERETLHDALIAAVKAAGGSKAVAAALWPSAAARDLDAARRKLASCLEPERPEKLSLDELVHVMRLARAVGCHAPMLWLARELHYSEPVPVRPRDEVDQLRREIVAMGRDLQWRMERLLSAQEAAAYESSERERRDGNT